MRRAFLRSLSYRIYLREYLNIYAFNLKLRMINSAELYDSDAGL